MSDFRAGDEAGARSAAHAVFLSYASEDAPAAERICSALRAAGIEVWFDRSELRGGDAWDAAIRRQIKSCSLFVPLISSNSHARQEGYFRLEWKLAVDRSHLMATDRAFLVPVVVDGTPDSDERVPDRFRDVQWTRLPGGDTTPEFVQRVLRLLDLPRTTRPAGDGSALRAVDSAAPTPTPAAALKHLSARRAVIAGVVLLLVAAAVTWGVTRNRGQTTTVVPYSLEDRRMTFAVLPFQAPPNDPHGVQVAAALTNQFSTQFDAETVWVHNLPRRTVDEAAARTSGVRELAKALAVHFLIRGTLTKTKAGYTAATAILDGQSERVLKTASTDIPGEALNPRWHSDVDDALYDFMWAAMTEESRRTDLRPIESLDVRDLTYRAYVGWSEHHGAEAKGAYLSASDLLKRALVLSPDDKAANYVLAQINLCDCVLAWSHDVESQKAVGAAALDRFLRMDPQNVDMIAEKAGLYSLRGRHEESLLIWQSLLDRDPEDPIALWGKASELLQLGRASDAQPISDGLVERYPNGFTSVLTLATAVHYAQRDYASAARFAQTAAARMRSDQLSSPLTGPVRLALAAAEARLGHLERAQAALADFDAAVPGTHTIAAMRKWIWPASVFSGMESLFDGLKAAGVPAE